MIPVDDGVVAELAPNGVLRAAVNLSNFLLVVGEDDEGAPLGPSPDLARAIAAALGVELELVAFANPADIAAASGKNQWDIANIGAEPQRAVLMDFSPPYAEIEATYLVPERSTLYAIAEVDQPGLRVSVAKGAAYALWLEDNLTQAQLLPLPGKAAYSEYVSSGLDAYAGLRSQLEQLTDSSVPSRVLDGYFTTVKQSIGVRKNCPAALNWITRFVETAKQNGFVAELIEKHNVGYGLSVAR